MKVTNDVYDPSGPSDVHVAAVHSGAPMAMRWRPVPFTATANTELTTAFPYGLACRSEISSIKTPNDSTPSSSETIRPGEDHLDLPGATPFSPFRALPKAFVSLYFTLVPLRPEPCMLAVRPSWGSHIGQDCPSASLERPSATAEWPSDVVVVGRRRIGAAAACHGSSGVRVRAGSRRSRQRR